MSELSVSTSAISPVALERDNAVSPAPEGNGGTAAKTAFAPVLLPLAAWAVLLGALAWPVLSWWRWEYTKPESYYGHAFFVPIMVGVMLWHRRRALWASAPRPAPLALLLVAPALALLVLAIKIEMEAIMSFSFLLCIWGGLWFVFGTRWMKAAAVPLAFLIMMAPLPGPVLNDMTLGAQRASTVGAAFLLKMLTFHPIREGNLIHMDSYTLNVDVACSGFKLLLTLLTFSAAFAYLTDARLSKRWGLFLFSLPLTLFINSFRIALIGIVGECIGASAAHTFHDWSGTISLVLCMALLFGSAKLLGCRTFAGQPIF